MRVLIVDDETKITNVLSSYFEKNGDYTYIAHTGESAIQIVDQVPLDMIILDLMLPDMAGEEICQYVKSNYDIPVIMLTAKISIDDKIKGFEMGADDYVCKPFSPKELVARVQAVLRRLERKAEPEQNDSFRIDKAQQRIWYQQKSLSLTPTEFRLLELFLEHVGQVYSRAQLLDHINPDSFDVADRVIDSHIKNLRRKITEVAETGNRHEWIQAVYGVGYRFEYPEE